MLTLRKILGFLAVLGTLAAVTWSAGAAVFPPLQTGDTSQLGRQVQRTLRLLATSTPERRNTVRVLFYGQSITEQKWAQLVADDLRARFPHANLVIENRALGGYASQMLVKTAETDLYSFQPDLLIFHVYGAHDKYEDIIRRVRERTTAEILMQNDHVTRPEDLAEETDPAKLWPPNGKNWDAFMNHRWLPEVGSKYGVELCDQRAWWKQYLQANQLEPKKLLRDGVHLNAHGEFLMAECVKAYLRYDPKLGPSPAESWVKTYPVGGVVRWQAGRLRLEFVGNRVDVILKPGLAATARVLIDGRKPSEIASLYGFTRALAKPGGKWPVVADLTWQNTPVVEDWTMEVSRSVEGTNQFAFDLRGSKTGPDGSGRSDRRFISNSGRVVIDPDDWNVGYALSLAQVKPVPDKFVVTWQTVARHLDEIPVIKSQPDPAVENILTLAQGLLDGNHTVEILGDETLPIAALRIYCPPNREKQ